MASAMMNPLRAREAEESGFKSNNLWVGSLTTDTTESDLTELFGRFGDIDRITAYSSRSFAFIYYRRVEEAVAAKEALQGANLNGSQIKIEFARPQTHDTYSGNSMTPSERSCTLIYDTGIAVEWTSEEQSILENGLVIYSSEPSLSRYVKIALGLKNKNVRDVAMRCHWLSKKAKRRKEDHNGLGRSRVDDKEIIDMVVASTSTPLMFAQSPIVRQEHGIISKLLEQNAQFLKQIFGNLKSLRVSENLTLLNESRAIIRNILKNLNENIPELMNHMPPLSEKLSDELLDSILPPSNPP